MSRSICFAQIANDHLSEVMGPDVSYNSVLDIIKEITEGEWPNEPGGKLFFSNQSIINLRSDNGVVETPPAMASYMVKLAYSRWCSEKNILQVDACGIKWFDPCVGAGVFPIEILRFYCNRLGASSPASLPVITVSEVSDLGLAVTFINIIKELCCFGINPSEYFRLGRLKMILGDTLDSFRLNNDIYAERSGFDIVIGNPPYVRASRLSLSYKKKLRQYFQDIYSGSADLYTYFIGSAISSINDDGVMVYISPASFIRAKSGATLRDWLLINSELDTFIDLDETKVFCDADLHAAVYVFKKRNIRRSCVMYRHIQNTKELDSLYEDSTTLICTSLDAPLGAGWAFHSSKISLEENSKLYSNCVRLQDLGIGVYSGLRPGYSAAFIIDAIQYEKFGDNIKLKWIKPIIPPASIKKWSGYKKLEYMIVIPAGTESVDDEIISFLEPHRIALARRTEIKNKDQWYVLRSCSYYNLMGRQNIIFPDISSGQRFSLSDEGIYIPDGAYFIDSDSLVLLGILNSEIAKNYFTNRCSSVGNLKSKGRYRFKKEVVKGLPLPSRCLSDGYIQREISRLVSQTIKTGEDNVMSEELNQLVSRLYKD